MCLFAIVYGRISKFPCGVISQDSGAAQNR